MLFQRHSSSQFGLPILQAISDISIAEQTNWHFFQELYLASLLSHKVLFGTKIYDRNLVANVFLNHISKREKEQSVIVYTIYRLLLQHCHMYVIK